MTVLKKVYKGNKLEFRPDGITPGFYIGYRQDGVKFEENTPGWGWTLAAFFESQLEELENWEDEFTTVTNLSTLEERTYNLPPAEAVKTAHLQDLADDPWEPQVATVTYGKHTVGCGDWCVTVG